MDVAFMTLKTLETVTIGSKAISANPGSKEIYITREKGASEYYMVVNTTKSEKGSIAVYSTQGQLLGTRHVTLVPGYNRLQVPAVNNTGLRIQIITLFTNNKMVFSQKLLH